MSFVADSPEAIKGRKGEAIVRELLQKVGWNIIDHTGEDRLRSPSLNASSGFVAALPDFDVGKRGVRRFVEVKYKDHREHFILWNNRPVHGISLKHFDWYKKTQEEMGTKLWLFIVEWKENNVISAPLDTLSMPCWHRVYQGKNENDPGGSIYFDIGAFRLFGIPRDEIFELKDRSWEPRRYMQ